jgi:hypothetical protein
VNKPRKLRFDSRHHSGVRTVNCRIDGTLTDSCIGGTKFSGEYHWIFAADRVASCHAKKHYTASPCNNADDGLYYGVGSAFTTVCTALLVPFTVLCATFLAVITVFFATCLAVRTGPACTLPAQTANARMTENNAFMVLIGS